MARRRPSKSGEDALIRSAEFIGWALGGLEREIAQTKERLASLNAQAAKLRGRIGGGPQQRGPAAAPTLDQPAVSTAGKRRGRMSADARKRISEMMKKRWAEKKRKGA